MVIKFRRDRSKGDLKTFTIQTKQKVVSAIDLLGPTVELVKLCQFAIRPKIKANQKDWRRPEMIGPEWDVIVRKWPATIKNEEINRDGVVRE